MMKCKNCGESIKAANTICAFCGAWNSLKSQESQDNNSQYDVASETAILINRYATSALFILGCVLITLGNLGAAAANPSWYVLLGTAFALVHIIGLWMIVTEALSSSSSLSKTLKSLTLFRISAILIMVLTCIVFGFLAITLLFTVMSGIEFLLFIAIVGGVAYLMVRFYFLALLKVLDCIRDRIHSGKYSPLEGLGSFLVISYIAIALSVIMVFIENGAVTLSTLFTILNSIGMLLCLRVLKRFDEYWH